jgi:hypothetical protein
LGEAAVLAVVARQVVQHGACMLAIGHVAALAGVCRSTVKRALREAEALGLIRIEERRLTAWRNLPHRITVTSVDWNAWLRHRRRGVEFKPYPPRISERIKGAPSAQRAAEKEGAEAPGRTRNRPQVANGRLTLA